MTVLFAVVNLLVLVGLATMLYRKEQGQLKKYFWPAFICKVLAGMAVGVIYTYYYPDGDTISYYKMGAKAAELAQDNPSAFVHFLWRGTSPSPIGISELPPRALSMVKWVACVNLVSHNNYWISSAYFSFLSFAGAWYLVRKIESINVRFVPYAAFAFLFLPSGVLWSSGILKEAVAMAALYLLVAAWLQLWFRMGYSRWAWLVWGLAAWVLWITKYYYFAVFLPLAVSSLVTDRVLGGHEPPKSLGWLLAFWLGVMLIPLALISMTRPNFYPTLFLGVVTTSNEEFRATSSPDNIIHYHDLAPTLGSFVRNAPWALISGLFRKLPWEANNAAQLVAGLENLLILILTFGSVRNLAIIPTARNRLLLITALTYCVVMCILLALSAPNFGTLSRYRLGFFPFFVFLVAINNPWVNWFVVRVQSSWHRLVG